MLGGTKEQEYARTAEMLVDIAAEQGIYYAVALLHDSQYSWTDLNRMLPILARTRGAVKRKKESKT